MACADPVEFLAAVYGLALDAAQRQVLGPDVAIDIEVIDETNTRVNIPKLIRHFRRHENFGMLGLVGVQSNQYPRALDIARPFRAAGIQVAMGGFHVSGCLSMLDGSAIDLDLARDMGISIFAGEAEDRFDAFLRDAAAGRLQPLYNYMSDLPGLGGTPIPFLPRDFVRRTAGTNASFDAGRGCPFQCSFCTIINVQGRSPATARPTTSRRSCARTGRRTSPASSSQMTISPATRSGRRSSIGSRNCGRSTTSRSASWIQVDTMCHKIGFIEKAKRAGVTRVFIGLENINPDNLVAAKKSRTRSRNTAR